jgi:uncharacterized protein (DUF2336 family)
VNAPFSESAREAGDVSEGTCWGVRAKCADRLASQYADGKLGLAERPEAEQALRLLRYDGETWVRRVVADAVKSTPFLPAEIAYLFATDRDEVAVPLIENSPVLRERDLLTLVRDFPGAHRLAVARRAYVRPRVADALCRAGEAEAVRALLANPGAEIPESSLRHLLDRRAELPGVAAAVARRLLDRPAANDDRADRQQRSQTAFRRLLGVVESGPAAAARERVAHP